MRGQTQPTLSGFSVLSSDFPGQKGRKVRSEASGARSWLSCAASGYTPKEVIPAWLIRRVSDQDRLVCAGRAGSDSIAGVAESTPVGPWAVR